MNMRPLIKIRQWNKILQEVEREITEERAIKYTRDVEYAKKIGFPVELLNKPK
jgi:hypothetical protein